MQTKADEGDKRAALVIKIVSSYSKMLSTILIGNNIVNIVASALATVFAARLFGSWAIGVATGILTIVVLLFGEIVPKTVSKLNNEAVCLAYAPIINLLCMIFTPIVFVVDILSNGLLRLFRIDPDKKYVSITESELLSYVDAGHEDGTIESEEKEIIHNVFEFSEASAKDIMIPRVDMVEIDVEASYQDVMDVFKKNMYTRIPVYESTPDNIVGVINIKDFLFVEDSEDFSIKNHMRAVYFTYEFKKTSELLNEMREKSEAITIVLNEYGLCEGMITMEDLLEELVGEIRDEYDRDEVSAIKKIGDNQYIINGSMSLDDINDELDLELESENYDSIGGIVIENLDDTMPKVGDEVALDNGVSIRVVAFKDKRIEKVKLTINQLEEKTEEQS